MGSTVNKVTLLGNVGKDPETRFTAEGMAVSSFSLATQKKSKGESVAQWHNCVTFGKLAEIIQQYVVKGSKIYAEGTIDYSSYEKDGITHYVTKIIVNEVSLLSSGDTGNQGKQKAAAKPSAQTPSHVPELDDDIPF